MTSLIRRLTTGQTEQRDSLPLPFQDYVNLFNFNNVTYPFLTQYGATGDTEKSVPQDYTGLVSGIYRTNGIVHALMTVRMLHFAQVRFQFRQIRSGRPGDLFGTAALAPLEEPWVNGTTGDLLARMIQDVDLSGNAYVVKQPGGYLARLRPDWIDILLGSRGRRDNWVPGDADTEVIAYIYHPGGRGTKAPDIVYDPADVAHWHPIPDPLANYRGMSWVSSIIREIMADTGMTMHKNKFLENGATVNMAITVPTENLELFERWTSKLREGHQGIANAYKMMILGSGATVTPVGTDMQQMDFATVQAAGETRMAAVAGVPPILVGFTEGLKGSSLNAGNYATARRRFSDGTIIPLWQSVSACLASIIAVPANAQLWFDTVDASFMKDDEKDAADIRQINASAMLSLVNAGFEPDAIVEAIVANDFAVLKGNHTGLTSVQLQPPANEGGNTPIPGPEDDVEPAPDPAANGSSNGVASRPSVPAQSGAK